MAEPIVSSHRKGEGLRALNRQRRADAVFVAAIELFVERGYDGTTMEAIADRAGVARASVFNYFPRKQAILAEWSARRRAVVHGLIADRDPEVDSLEPRLLAYMDAWATLNEHTVAETAACGSASLRETDRLTNSGLGHELTELLAAAADRGELRKGTDVELAGVALAAGYFALLTRWIATAEPRPDFHVELRTLTLQSLHGLLAD